MTLETVYYLGQTLAVLAVLASLVFVGLQVKQNTKALKATSHHAITDSFNQLNAIIGTDPKAARIWRLGHFGLDKLDEDEQVSFAYLCIAYTRVFETLYFQNKNGTMDASLFETENRSLRWAMGNSGFREWWSTNPISFSDEYRRFLDGIMAETPLNQE